jgi:uncharacterized protein HemX
MSSVKQDESGFSPVESLLVIVIVAILGFVGWYVYHAQQTANKSLNATASSTTPHFAKDTKTAVATGSDTSNANLQSDLGGVSSANGNANKDMSTTNNSLSDKSTLTSVPQ